MKEKGRLEFQAMLVEGLGTRHPATAILTHQWSVVCTRQVFSAFDSGELFAYKYLWNEVRRFLGVRDCMQPMRSGGQATAMAAAQMHQEEEPLFLEAQTDVMMPRRWTVKMVTGSC